MAEAIEPLAVILLVVSVVLSVKRSIWQYPIGIVATLLYVAVFFRSQLYSSAALNVFFSAAQIYGWWFWLFGQAGRRPRITSWPPLAIAAICLAGLALAAIMAAGLARFTDAALPLADSGIFGLSVAAQFLLDRKKVEHWMVWGVVNLLSVGVYAAQELWPTAILYAALFFNVFWGWSEWRREMASYGAPA